MSTEERGTPTRYEPIFSSPRLAREHAGNRGERDGWQCGRVPPTRPGTSARGTSSWGLGRLGRGFGLGLRGRLGRRLALTGRPILGGLLRLVLLILGIGLEIGLPVPVGDD